MGTVTIVSNDGDSRFSPTAVEMASVESRKTREKLRTKADHVRVDEDDSIHCSRSAYAFHGRVLQTSACIRCIKKCPMTS